MFFRGDITGAGSHDEMAKKIALAGARWARTFWRDEDATAYMYRLVFLFSLPVLVLSNLLAWFPDVNSDTLQNSVSYRLMLEYARVISLDRDAMTMDVTEYGLSPPKR